MPCRRDVYEAVGATEPGGEADLAYALRVLGPLYPGLTAETPADLQLLLRQEHGWLKAPAQVSAFWVDLNGGCGFVTKLVQGEPEFMGAAGSGRRLRWVLSGRNFSVAPGGCQ